MASPPPDHDTNQGYKLSGRLSRSSHLIRPETGLTGRCFHGETALQAVGPLLLWGVLSVLWDSAPCILYEDSAIPERRMERWSHFTFNTLWIMWRSLTAAEDSAFRRIRSQKPWRSCGKVSLPHDAGRPLPLFRISFLPAPGLFTGVWHLQEAGNPV